MSRSGGPQKANDNAVVHLAGAETITGAKTFQGAVGLNGNAPVGKAAAIASPTAPGVVYAQAEAAAMKTAVDAIRAALTNVGITA